MNAEHRFFAFIVNAQKMPRQVRAADKDKTSFRFATFALCARPLLSIKPELFFPDENEKWKESETRCQPQRRTGTAAHIAFNFNRCDYGRLRQMVDVLNGL